VLLPSVMQTLVLELFGTPPLQLLPLFQLLLEPWDQVSGELNVHCATADAAAKATINAAPKDAIITFAENVQRRERLRNEVVAIFIDGAP
jgi:hypothetical protein